MASHRIRRRSRKSHKKSKRTTVKGDKDYHVGGHRVKKASKPYSHHKKRSHKRKSRKGSKKKSRR
jgi:hypothetical protein